MNVTAIASAIADRFAAAAITPPSGYTDPGTAVYLLPDAIASTPTAVVFPPEGEFSYAVQKRSGNLEFPVRWYIAETSDLPRATAKMYAWASRPDPMAFVRARAMCCCPTSSSKLCGLHLRAKTRYMRVRRWRRGRAATRPPLRDGAQVDLRHLR